MFQLSVIIVNYNTRDLLRNAIHSIENYLPKKILQEIFVVDNDSRDGSVEMIKREFPGVNVIENSENFGFAKANNQAIGIVKGEVILLLNSDTLLIPDHEFEFILQRFEKDEQLGIVGGRVFYSKMRQVSSYGHNPVPYDTPFTLFFNWQGSRSNNTCSEKVPLSKLRPT